MKKTKQSFDYVVLMAGYHGSIDDFAKEFSLFNKTVKDKKAKLIFLTFRESRRYPLERTGGMRSVFNKLNVILKELVSKKGYEDVIVADWNLFSSSHPEWFHPEGIHPNIKGTVALGWFISQVIAEASANPCPFDDLYLCDDPEQIDPKINWLSSFKVKSTNFHCYEDGVKRKRACETNRRQ